jgi:hypothetical protein
MLILGLSLGMLISIGLATVEHRNFEINNKGYGEQ